LAKKRIRKLRREVTQDQISSRHRRKKKLRIIMGLVILVVAAVLGVCVVTRHINQPYHTVIAPESVLDEVTSNTATPAGLVLNYRNPKIEGSNCWTAWLYDPTTQEWSADKEKVLTGESIIFELKGNNFLIRFQECRNKFFDDYLYGPFLLTVSGLGNYTWDAAAEEMNGIKILNLPESKNLCTITGEVIGSDDDGHTIDIRLQSAEDILRYNNAGRFFIGSVIKAKSDVKPSSVLQKEITAKLKMTKLLLGDGKYGYMYRWEATKVRVR